jgi:hypothetical protein
MIPDVQGQSVAGTGQPDPTVWVRLIVSGLAAILLSTKTKKVPTGDYRNGWPLYERQWCNILIAIIIFFLLTLLELLVPSSWLSRLWTIIRANQALIGYISVPSVVTLGWRLVQRNLSNGFGYRLAAVCLGTCAFAAWHTLVLSGH